MKKATVYILALGLLLACLAGCADTGKNQVKPTATPMTTLRPTTAPEVTEPDVDDGIVNDDDGVITDDDNGPVATPDASASARPSGSPSTSPAGNA